MNQSRCLVLDVETSAMEALVFERHDVNIGLDNIIKDWQIIAWSAKWLNEKKIYYYDTRIVSERNILLLLWNLLDAADIVITQNGQKFDSRRINARFIHYGMKPPSPYRHLDTYRIAKKVGDFTSNSLEYLADKLCTKYKKLKHGKFPGIKLWDECRKGNIDAWEEMKKYNIRDTLVTEELYTKLRAWAPESMPKPHKDGFSPTIHCDTCDYKGVMTKWGFYRTNNGIWTRYACPHCGAFRKGSKLHA
jgi:uncharacterized protein YprB with RNaseH-like and TPR domain